MFITTIYWAIECRTAGWLAALVTRIVAIQDKLHRRRLAIEWLKLRISTIYSGDPQQFLCITSLTLFIPLANIELYSHVNALPIIQLRPPRVKLRNANEE